MNVTLYARVSTVDQNVNQQMQELRKWAIRNEHRIVKEVWDEESGTIPLLDRKKFIDVLDNPKGEALIVFNLDRLSRYWADEPVLETYFIKSWDKYKLISLHDEINLDHANGRLMFRIKFAVNCQYVEDMKEKQGVGIQRAKEEGKYTGRKKGAKGKK